MSTWYKTAAEQSRFPFSEDVSALGQSPSLYHSVKSKETLDKLMDESVGYLAVESNLIRYGYDWELVKSPEGERIIRVKIGDETYVIDDFRNPKARPVDGI